jgi:STE24 endopeptidase
VSRRDIRRGLLYLAIVAPIAMWAVAEATRRLQPGGRPGPNTVPALAASLALVALPVSIAANGLSRAMEARADSDALRLTDDPEAAISFQRRISVRNVSDPDPPRWRVNLLATHPPTIDRIGIAKAYEAGSR